MTRSSSLVLDGDTIKYRLQAERFSTKSAVHIDWLRFTVQRRIVSVPAVELLFPTPENCGTNGQARASRLYSLLLQTPDCDTGPAVEAYDLGNRVCKILGSDFSLALELRKGHDFYKFRWSIMRAEAEVGWVGFMSSSTSPRQAKQGKTIHCNLYGAACTFAQTGWASRLADLVDQEQGDITRADLALDFFDGLPGGFESVVEEYKNGLCDVGGRRLVCSTVGDWINGHSRSFYLGSKESGKQTNFYEKGDQLYGVDACSPWVRAELRYGNKLRVLPSDILRRPADFFAGASEWHSSLLSKADQQFSPAPVTCTPRLQVETVEAEVTRNVRWAFTTAGPTFALLFEHLGDRFLDLVDANQKRPGRLQKFKPSEIADTFSAALSRFLPAAQTGHLAAAL